MDRDHGSNESSPRFWRSRYGIGMLVLGAIAGYFLLKEHTAHVVGFLPFLLLAACPLMHLFMHHGHGGHDHASHTPPDTTSTQSPNPGAGSNADARDQRGDQP
ncbi:DUF2933 domain-containing protein [Burkholderia sp. BE17]|uniref:DUF2933 domain-containing protein n=1 Tax=Burkholderia sp. BE17 TaxID=2656644 RepID=UPI00128B240D|nr:DUF2933 domain-containing protein [Burkholderia sp. BE17]MPV70470.1 DUF2933 domain-containing protein [Burkholderia sp. BE17]